jgi:TonB family protein
VRPASALASFLNRISSGTSPRWPEVAQVAPTPTPAPRATPKPRLVYAPAPAFPRDARLRPGVPVSGRFRLSFNAKGSVTNIQIVQSTGSEIFDRAAIGTLQQWKSAPGQEWATTVPVTFQTR